ncbi:hypothetical protein [Streptomyces siamensis]|uniref:Uncharacterized protein n=1 Tax=Streptomyces siamensis TaxID=1274986 RepID=A0ABP9IYJ4_9ACTN
MDLATLADTATTAYVTGVAGHAAAGADGVVRAQFARLRAFFGSNLAEESELAPLTFDELSARVLRFLEENPDQVESLAGLLGKDSSEIKIEGAGTVHGNVELKGKYVAGRDIRFDGR